MANWYINPGLGTGTNAGTSWANAFNSTTLAWTAAITASAAGDDFYINAASTVTNTTAQVLTFKGTAAAPNRIFSCSTITNNPPLSADLGVGAAHTTTGASSLTIDGFIYVYGCTFNTGTGTTAANVNIGTASSSEMIFDSCQLKQLVTTATNTITLGGNTNNKITFINTPVTLNGGTASTITVNASNFTWKNTPSAVPGTQAAIANLISPASIHPGDIILDSVDFAGTTGIASGKNIIAAAANGSNVQMVNCKFIAGALVARQTVPFGFTDQIVSDSGATGWKQQRDMYQGTLTADSAVFNSATDGTTPISWKVITTANAKPQSPFECFGIVQWVPAGTYASSKIFCTSATAALTTADVWVDVQYLGASFALGSPATSFGAGSGTTILPQIPAGTTPGALASGTWGTGGLGNNYKLVIPSFTTSAAGYVRLSVKVGKASLTVNIDPLAVIA